MQEAVPSGITVEVAGKEYDLRPLNPDDFSRAERNIRQERLNDYFDVTKGRPIGDDVRAAAMAQIICSKIDLTDIVSSYTGQLSIVWLAMVGDRPPFAEFRRTIKVDTVTVLGTIVGRLTGLVPAEENENPTMEGSDSSLTGDES